MTRRHLSPLMPRSLRVASLVLVAWLAGASEPAISAEATGVPELKVSVAGGPAMPLGKAAQRWAELITEGAGQRFVAKLHPGATLAGRDPAREFGALMDGPADLAVGSALQWSIRVPALAVFSLPWIAPEQRDLEALTGDDPLRAALAAKLDAAGVVLVALAPLGYREIATTVHPVRAPSDLQGLRLRTAPMPLLQEVLLAFGAKPESMPFIAAQNAFAAGSLDGQEGPPTMLAAARAAAGGQKHLTDWGAFADAMVFAVRKAIWDAWAPAQREAVARAARQAIGDADALGREANAMRQLAANGVAVVRITPAGHAAFKKAVETVTARWRPVVGEEIVTLADRALATAPVEAPPKRP